MSSSTREIIHLCELGVLLIGPTPLFADNTSAICIANNLVFHERTKQIEVDCHFIREHVVSKDIALPYVSSNNQLADLLTKAMSKSQHDLLISKLMLQPSASISI